MEKTTIKWQQEAYWVVEFFIGGLMEVIEVYVSEDDADTAITAWKE